MSRLPWWWRTRWNAITIVTCSPSWIIIFLNAYCASWILQGAFLFECDLNPNQLLGLRVLQVGLWHCTRLLCWNSRLPDHEHAFLWFSRSALVAD